MESPERAHFVPDGEGRVAVNRTLRFETLAAGWKALIVEIGLPGPELLYITKTPTSEMKPNTTYYMPKIVASVRGHYRRDFELFWPCGQPGYEMVGRGPRFLPKG